MPIVILIGMCSNFTFQAQSKPLEYIKQDEKIAKSAAIGCKRRGATCLAKLIRKEINNYHAVCR